MRLRVWFKRIGIVLGIEFLALIIFHALDSWHLDVRRRNCPGGPLQTAEDYRRAADEAVKFWAKSLGLPPDQFFLKKRHDVSYLYQLRGDRERPRRIDIKVIDCVENEAYFYNLPH